MTLATVQIIQQCRKCKIIFISNRLLLLCQKKNCSGFMGPELPVSVLDGAIEISEKEL